MLARASVVAKVNRLLRALHTGADHHAVLRIRRPLGALGHAGGEGLRARGLLEQAARLLLDPVRLLLVLQEPDQGGGHGGVLHLVEVKGGSAYLKFDGRCQGCAMAEVTLRQGVEVMIREKVPGVVAVVDVTDHTRGIDPYFKTKKGPD